MKPLGVKQPMVGTKRKCNICNISKLLILYHNQVLFPNKGIRVWISIENWIGGFNLRLRSNDVYALHLRQNRVIFKWNLFTVDWIVFRWIIVTVTLNVDGIWSLYYIVNDVLAPNCRKGQQFYSEMGTGAGSPARDFETQGFLSRPGMVPG